MFNEILILGLSFLSLVLILNGILSTRKLEPVKDKSLNNNFLQTKIKR